MPKTITIDEEGFFLLDNGIRVDDTEAGRHFLENMSKDDFGVIHMDHQGEDVIVEAFDKPFVARQVHYVNDRLQVQMPYDLIKDVDWNSLCLDEWDRFHGKTTSGMPFVLSRAAQAELFNLATGFTDDSLEFGSREIETPPYYLPPSDVGEESFWTKKYNENPNPPWNLNEAHPEFKSALPQLKIHKSRVLVPGCGYGHDAALLAEKGHVVTAVDISPNAIAEAKKLYGHIKNLEFILGDAFNLGEDHHQAYDLVLEHTCYCAIPPTDRARLVQAWKRYLVKTGHLLGIFFVVPNRGGPYFGGSEWELREKLQNDFQFLYWTRLKHSPGWRLGAELMVYAQLKTNP